MPPTLITVAGGWMLILPAFASTTKRITADLDIRRDEFVAALADEAYIAHSASAGHVERIVHRLSGRGVSLGEPK